MSKPIDSVCVRKGPEGAADIEIVCNEGVERAQKFGCRAVIKWPLLRACDDAGQVCAVSVPSQLASWKRDVHFSFEQSLQHHRQLFGMIRALDRGRPSP